MQNLIGARNGLPPLYRYQIWVSSATEPVCGRGAPACAEIVGDAAETIARYGKQNLSGTPFTSRTGTHTIQKRSGRGAASYPYGSPFRSRVSASAYSRYANNSEEVNYLAVLEYGRGEIRPQYTPPAARGDFARAQLTIPGGPHSLVNGQNIVSGISSR